MKFATILEQLEMENLAKREEGVNGGVTEGVNESPGKRYQREYQEIKNRHWQETQRKLLLANLKTN